MMGEELESATKEQKGECISIDKFLCSVSLNHVFLLICLFNPIELACIVRSRTEVKLSRATSDVKLCGNIQLSVS